MENAKKTPNDQEKQPGKITRFFTKRVILGIVLAVGILWMISLLLGSFDQQPPQTASAPTNQASAHVQPAHAETEHLASTPQPPQMHAGNQASHHLEPGTHDADQGHGPQPAAETEATHSTSAAEHQAVVPVHPAPDHTPQPATAPATTHAAPAADHQVAVPAQGTQVRAAPSAHRVATIPAASTPQPKTPVHSAPSAETAQASHETPAEQGGHGAPVESFPVKGMAFVNAIIKPLDQELNQE